MTDVTNKVRAALEAALSDDQPYIDRCKEALSLLEGHVIVPVEPTDEQLTAAAEDCNEWQRPATPWWGLAPIYRAMIAPYLRAGG